MGKQADTVGSLVGMIFDIQRFSLHDGPGIRTLVFIKGCPLRCRWCSNPESQSPDPEVIFYDEKCIGCGECMKVCPLGEALRDNWPVDRENCTGCGSCVEECYAEARKLVGRKVHVDEVLGVVLRDRVFYEQSGGGVTVGGGEPLAQADFVAELLRKCREQKIHTAVETCGFASWQAMEKVLQYTDLLLYDLKHMDTEIHKKYTGAGNERILENAKKASKIAPEMVVRFPLIPTINSSQENIRSLAQFIRSELHRVNRVDILPYHSIGASKSIRLGREYSLEGIEPLKKHEIDKAKAVLESQGLRVTIGG
jgi:pyruvate formate lyase activating enzyme